MQTKIYPLFLIVLILTLFGVWSQQSTPPPFTPLAECKIEAETVEPLTPWHFRLAPNSTGLANQWYTHHQNPNWDISSPGIPWENQGYEEYDGVAWYETVYELPAHWQTAYLGTVQIDDHARLWINGTEVPFNNLVPLPIGEPVHITYRIEDLGGLGGIKQPVTVGQYPWSALPSGDYVRHLGAEYPTYPWAGWVTGGYHAWTFTGIPQAPSEALITSQAAIAPWAEAPQVAVWLTDNNGQHITPQPTFSLVDEVLPIPRATWQHDKVEFAGTLFTPFDNTGTYYQLTAHNPTDQPLTTQLTVAVQPIAIHNDRRPIYALGFDRQQQLWLDGQPFIRSSQSADSISTHAFPESTSTASHIACASDGNATATLTYDITLPPQETWELSLVFPNDAGNPLPNPHRASAQLAQTRQNWQAILHDPHFTIPDQFVTNGYLASLGYLLIALDPDGPHPGPLAHDALWVRDAAFIGETLLHLGYGDIVEEFIPSLFAYQQADGYVPAIITPTGPRPDVEWDAQGQLMFLIAEWYRYQPDQTQLAQWYPHVRQAGQFLRHLRTTTLHNPPATRGILPPSKSAEDLGSEEWHHYWDNFWAIAGLENGAYLATELGYPDDAQWMQTEAHALRLALRDSITAVMGENPAYIPNGPEDITSSAMARGTANSLYPVLVFDRTDPLIIRSFDEYHQRWIEPQGGGYKHIFEKWWPYGGLGLARDYLRLGRQDILHQILGWTLTHQTLPGTFAWAEQVDPATQGFSGGDMPHAWAASSYLTLIREMLLIHEGDTLELFAGVPPSWLTAGKTVALHHMPTPYGNLNAHLESTLTITDNHWAGQLTLTLSGAHPPAGYRWRLPHPPTSVAGDGIIVDGWLEMPATASTITLTYE